MRSVVLRAFEQISASGKLKLFRSYRPEYADGEQMRDFLYVKDAVDMVLFLFEHPQGAGIYNIGSGRAETWNAACRRRLRSARQARSTSSISICRRICATVTSTIRKPR